MPTRVSWTIYAVDTGEPELSLMFAILPDDLSNGLLIGEIADVEALTRRLQHFLATGEHDGQIDDTDPQLGTPWLSASEASQEYAVPQSSITWACRQGKIRRAEKGTHGWTFPQRTFLAWLVNRPGSGRHS